LLTAEDRWAIGETISLHGHLFDEGHLDRLEELFTSDVVYDVTDVGIEPLHGIAEIRRAALDLGAANPLAHHVTNIIITSIENDCVKTQCKAFVVEADGRCGSATYVDTLRRENDRWRISHRIVLARRIPLGGTRTADSHAAQAEPQRRPGTRAEDGVARIGARRHSEPDSV
jgi:SnoaL-like domain